MIEIINITVRDSNNDKTYNKIKISHCFSSHHQIERFRKDMQHYYKMQGFQTADLHFTIKNYGKDTIV